MARSRLRPFRVGVENLESREVPTVATSSVAAEIYTWNLVNQMRANPAQFANDIQALVNGQPGTYQGYTASDPVWTELRTAISRNPVGSGWSLDQPLNFLRAQPSLPPLMLQDDLSARAADHTAWMLQHGFAHTQVATQGPTIQGFPATPAATPDAYDHDPNRYLQYTGENIDYGYNSAWPFEAAKRSGAISEAGYEQRLAYVALMHYVLDIGLPDLGHLRNMFGRPDGMTAGLTGPLAVYPLDSIGIDVSFASLFHSDGLPDEYITTMRFDNVRDNSPKPGQWSGLAFSDANGNGQFDVGETYQLLATSAGTVVVPTTSVTPTVTPTATPPATVGTPQPSAGLVAAAPTVAVAPQAVGVRAVRNRRGLTSVVVQFSGALDANSAAALGAYSLSAQRPGLSASARVIRVREARFDPTTNSVTLILARPFTLGGRVRVAVAPSITSAAGVGLASAFVGFVTK